MDPIYLNDFAKANYKNQIGKDAVVGEFAINASYLDGANILVASYTQACYEGDAFVLFERGGRLYEVHGSHCSCYGLEGQWKPEEVEADVLRARLTKGTYGEENDVKEHVFKALDALESQ